MAPIFFPFCFHSKGTYATCAFRVGKPKHVLTHTKFGNKELTILVYEPYFSYYFFLANYTIILKIIEESGMHTTAKMYIVNAIYPQDIYPQDIIYLQGIYTIHTGHLPTGSLPTGNLPTENLLTGNLPTGNLPTENLPTGHLLAE